MLACLLWSDFQAELAANKQAGMHDQPAQFEAMDTVLERQRTALAFPRRFDGTIKEIWVLQARLTQRSGGKPFRLLGHPRFRAGYDFLLIRARGGDAETELADWWTRFQDADEDERTGMLVTATAGEGSKRKRRKRPRRKPGDDAVEVTLG
jgi:poly(A) polymerase